MRQFENSLTNVPIVGEDLMKVFFKLLYLRFCDSSDQGKNNV